jgi:L-lysine exporter family protein LysE/ArgO
MTLNWFVAASGFGIALGLIAAIGAQNAHVLRQGIAGRQVAVTIFACIFCDTLLMAAGVYGMGAIVELWPPFEWVTRIGGALFLIGFGSMCFRSALKNHVLGIEGRVIESFWPALWTILGVTLLNPHVYLDTLVFIGGLGAQYGSEDQLSFAVGAVSASWVWFLTLGYGARLLRPTFENPKAWTILDIGIGLLMWSIALTLLL